MTACDLGRYGDGASSPGMDAAEYVAFGGDGIVLYEYGEVPVPAAVPGGGGNGPGPPLALDPAHMLLDLPAEGGVLTFGGLPAFVNGDGTFGACG